MKWEDFEKQMSYEYVYSPYTETNIECPECGKKIKMRNDIVLTTWPAQYQYECECGWVGYSHNSV